MLTDTLKGLEAYRHLKGSEPYRHLKGADPTQETTQESKSEDYYSENTLLQSGAEPASAEPAPTEINKDPSPEPDDLTAERNGDKRHSPNGHTRPEDPLEGKGVVESPPLRKPKPPELSALNKNWIYAMIVPHPITMLTDLSSLADLWLDGGADVKDLAEEARRLIGGDTPLEAFIPHVEACLEARQAELEGLGEVAF